MNQETLLRDLRPFLWSMARHYTDDFYKAQDLAQEGWIAAWRAFQKDPRENPLAFAKQAAKWQMTRCVNDVRWTTNAGVRGPHTALRPVPIDSTSVDWERLVEEFDVVVAYHDNEIARAIDGLSDIEKKYVQLRFWGGLNSPELREHFGYEVSKVWTRTKGKLADRLAHLKETI